MSNSNFREIAVVIGLDNIPIYWHTENTTAGSISDSSFLWNVIWENRNNIKGVAHSHPGSGYSFPSFTDLSTFSALDLGLGRKLTYWITSSDRVLEITKDLVVTEPYIYLCKSLVVEEEPYWVAELREKSQY